MESKGYPFCKAEFFDQFEIGRTVLLLRFLQEKIERTEPIVDSAKGQRVCLVEREALGVYRGHSEDGVQLQTTRGIIDAIPTISIRALKELEADELERILCHLTQSLCRLPAAGNADLPTVITAFNALRAMIDQHSILIPRAPIA